MGENDITLNRRQTLMTSVATIAAASITFLAFAADPILIGVPCPHGNTSQASVDLVRNNPDKYRNITDVQFPVQDWTPIIQAQKAADCGVIMIDHWVAAELASFALADVLGLTPGAPVYLQYGLAQPEFLDLAGDAAEGFVWAPSSAPMPTRWAWRFGRLAWRNTPAPWAWFIPARAMTRPICWPVSGPRSTRPISTA